MKTLYPKTPLKRSISAESIRYSDIKSFEIAAQSSKWFRWADQHAGDCTLASPQLFLYPDGVFQFTGNLSSSSSDDSWGILHIDFKQDNGLVLWSSGAFWSPTIGDWGPWEIWSPYPKHLFNTIALVQFFSHC